MCLLKTQQEWRPVTTFPRRSAVVQAFFSSAVSDSFHKAQLSVLAVFIFHMLYCKTAENTCVSMKNTLMEIFFLILKVFKVVKNTLFFIFNGSLKHFIHTQLYLCLNHLITYGFSKYTSYIYEFIKVLSLVLAYSLRTQEACYLLHCLLRKY